MFSNIKAKDVINFFLEILVTSLILYAVLLVLNAITRLIHFFISSIIRLIGREWSAWREDGLSLRQMIGAAMLALVLAGALFKWLQHVRSTATSNISVSQVEITGETAESLVAPPEGTAETIIL